MNDWSKFELYKKKCFYFYQVFSVFANILLLVLPIYSLQIYNRVLSSRSLDTLIYLVIITLFLVAVQVVMDFVRQQVINNVVSVYDAFFSDIAVKKSITNGECDSIEKGHFFKDYQLSKQYLSSPFYKCLTDLPWSFAFILVLFFLHPILGSYALFSFVLLSCVGMTLLYVSNKTTFETKRAAMVQASSLQMILGKSQRLKAHSISDRIIERWKHRNEFLIEHESIAKRMTNKGQSWLKLFRLMVQIGVFAVSAWLVIDGEIMSGSMIASSILISRILAPIDQGANHYFSWYEAKKAYAHVTEIFREENKVDRMDVSMESIDLLVQNISYKASSNRYLVKQISFNLKPGSCLLVEGESGSGKSTLLKLLSQSLVPTEGSIKLNGICSDKINYNLMAEHISYLPQQVELFMGSIADNICGFERGDDVSQKIIRASKLARCHEFIAKLPKSYSSILSDHDVILSSSEKQRIAIAKCLYNNPKLIILDEPTVFMSELHETFFLTELERLKLSGASIIIITSSGKLKSITDYTIVLDNGAITQAIDNKKEKVELKRKVFSAKNMKY